MRNMNFDIQALIDLSDTCPFLMSIIAYGLVFINWVLDNEVNALHAACSPYNDIWRRYL